MKTMMAPTYTCEIYIAGNMADIERACAQYCMRGLCVSVEAVKFIYTGGREDGAVIRLVNYPRFPEAYHLIREKARDLAEKLIEACCQSSALVVIPGETTEWLTRRPDTPQ